MERKEVLWTKEEDEILKQAAKRRMAPKEISETLLPHRSEGSISGRARRLGFNFGKRPLQYVHDQTQYNPIIPPDEPHDSLTAALMGDPTPSRSALARRGEKEWGDVSTASMA